MDYRSQWDQNRNVVFLNYEAHVSRYSRKYSKNEKSNKIAIFQNVSIEKRMGSFRN